MSLLKNYLFWVSIYMPKCNTNKLEKSLQKALDLYQYVQKAMDF